jgi:lipid II:glycine glycyltransferase (peptidoglycan interpeptide bridge formation enzyme)
MGITVYSSKEIKDLESFFSLYNETSKRHGFVQHKGVQQEFEVFAPKDKALVYYATHEGKIIATAVILFVGNQAIYHHGASISTSLPGSYAIQWEAIKEAKKRGMSRYNFWGIAPDDNPDHPWKGLTLFKKGFGGEQKQYLHAQDYAVSPLYIFPKTIETIRRIRKGY